MARKADDISNGFESAVVQNLVGKIEGYFADIESERGKYMQTCRGIRESISACYDEAKARGVPPKELRTLIKYRQKLDAAQAVLEDLEADQAETCAMLCEAFGDARDLPLFDFRIKRAAAAEQQTAK